MEVSSLDCYDVFNDYLGLSNVVGTQEDPYNFLVQSLLASDLKTGGPISTETGNRMEVKELSCQDGRPPMPGSPKKKLSDVERLFGRGATLQKASPSSVSSNILRAPCTTQNQAVSSHNKRFGGRFPSQNAVMSTTKPYDGICGQVCRRTCSDRVESALDAIIEKYDRLYSQQKLADGYNRNAENIAAEDWSNSTIASLTAALQKAAGFRNGTQSTYSPTACDSSCFHGTVESVFLADESAGGIYQNNSRFIGCSFCKNNKEVKEWFMSHQLKDDFGKVTCPVLRSYVCPLCNATGDNSHTIGHCPLNPDRRKSLPLAIRSKANATGKKKYP